MKEYVFKQADVFGTKANFIFDESPKQNDSCMVFYPGRGETGNSDGSQLQKVRSVGPAMHVKNGKNYDFHLITPQAPTGGSYESMNKYFLEWLIVRFGFKKIFITGLSLGGQATHNLTMKDLTYKHPLYVGAMPVAGRLDAYGNTTNPPNPADVKDLPMMVIHNEKDPIVSCPDDEDWCKRVNAVPGRVNKIEFIKRTGPGITGVHGGWDWAYEYNENNPCFQFYSKMLAPDVVTDRFAEGVMYAKVQLADFIQTIK